MGLKITNVDNDGTKTRILPEKEFGFNNHVSDLGRVSIGTSEGGNGKDLAFLGEVVTTDGVQALASTAAIGITGQTLTVTKGDGTTETATIPTSSSPETVACSMVLTGTVALAKVKDYEETTTTTTLVYAVGEYIANTASGIMYECILVNTVGLLLTNATYFTAVTTNALSYTDAGHIYTNGKNSNGSFNKISESALTGTYDLTGVSDGMKYLAKVFGTSTLIALDEYPIVVKEVPTGVLTEYQFSTDSGLWYDKTSTPLATPISFISRYPYMVISETPQYEMTDEEDIPVNIMDSLVISGAVESNVPKTAEVIAYEAINGYIPEEGSTYTDEDAIGANATAVIYPDGTIVGSTDNGEYTKYPNGNLVCSAIGTTLITTSVATGSVYRSSSTPLFTFPVAFIDTTISVTQIADNSAGYFWAGKKSVLSVAAVSFFYMGATSSTSGYSGYSAIGRWK